jgi:hypothetical protein
MTLLINFYQEDQIAGLLDLAINPSRSGLFLWPELSASVRDKSSLLSPQDKLEEEDKQQCKNQPDIYAEG